MRLTIRQRIGAALYRMLFDEHRQKFLPGDDMASGGAGLAGVDVNGTTAMQFSAFFSGVLQISQTLASLPMPVYRRLGEDGRERFRAHPLYPLLNRRANPWTTAFAWRETMTHHALVWGNGYSLRLKDRANRPIGFLLLNPERTAPKEQNGRVVYELTRNDGTAQFFEKDEILHLPGIGFDGIRGYSLLTMAQESLGVGLAQQDFSARFFGTGTHLGAVLERPKEAQRLDEAAAKRLVTDFALKYQGIGNAHKVLLLEEGMTLKPVGMPLKDAEFLGSRVFSIQDIARFLNMPPHKLKDLSRATFSNVEHEQLSWVIDTIRPWCVRWESVINADLLTPDEQDTVFAEHLVDALLRGDLASRYNAYAIARQNGWYNANDIRRKENENPIEGPAGDLYLVNGNMIPTEKAAGAGQAAPSPTPEPEPRPQDDTPSDGDQEDDNAEG